jgi:hypothetical protein
VRPDFDWQALRARVAAARNETEPTPDKAAPETEPEVEDLDQISRRMFHGGELSDTAARMFRI